MTTITLDPVAQGAPMAMRCPKCAADMYRYERSGVVIDQCAECRGVFLDRGELEQLLDAEAARPTPRGAGLTHRALPRDAGRDYHSDWDVELDHRPWDTTSSGGWDHRSRRDPRGANPRRQRNVLAELLDRIGD